MGLVTGILFGFLLQKATVLRYDRQLSALRLKDMTIVKFMLSAVCVSMVGVYLLHDLGMVSLSIKSTVLGANIIGAVLFDLGWDFWDTALAHPWTRWGKAGMTRSIAESSISLPVASFYDSMIIAAALIGNCEIRIPRICKTGC